MEPIDSAAPAPAFFPWLRLLRILVFLPGLWLGYLIYTYGVDTPYWDEWDEMPGLLLKLHAGTLSWSDLIAQHNEHRILFPRLIMLAAAWLTSWNVRAEMLITWLLAGFCAFNLWRLNRATGGTNSNLDLVLLTSANVLLFTPIAFENWLWGFQIGFLLPLTVVTMALWLITVSRPFWAWFFAIVLSFVCTFSMASGVLCWLVTLPLLLFRNGRFVGRDKIRSLIGWLVLFLGSVALYAHGYTKPQEHPDFLLMFKQPGTAVLYLLAYFGNPFGWAVGFGMMFTASGVLLLLFVGALVCLWFARKDTTLIARALPWIMLCVYSLLNGLFTMAGRLGFGIGQATAPRYVSFSVLLPIGLLFIWAAIYTHWRKGNVTRPQVQIFSGLLVGCLVLGLAMNLFSALLVLSQWRYWQMARIVSKVLVEFVPITNEEALMNGEHFTFGNAQAVREDSRRLAGLGYLRPAPVTDPDIAPLADSLEISPEHGYFDHVVQTGDGAAYVYGWAAKPDIDQPADAVLLTYEDPAHPGHDIIFGIAPTGYIRADVVRATQSEGYRRVGWYKPLTPGLLPPGPHLLRAWAFDVDENRAYRLSGEFLFDASPNASAGGKKH